MKTKEIGKLLKDEIEEQYGNITNFCKENNINYMPFANKLSNIRKGKGFQAGPIIKTFELLGYEWKPVKINKKNDKKLKWKPRFNNK